MTLATLAQQTQSEVSALVNERNDLRDKLAQSASENLKLRLSMSCLLPMAEQLAVTDIEKRTCAYIRSALGEPPLKVKPELYVVGEK